MEGKFEVENLFIDKYAQHCGVYGTAVYMLLARYANKYKSCYPTQKQIAERLGVSRYSVLKGIKSLELHNIINRRKCNYGNYGNYLYYIQDLELWRSCEKNCVQKSDVQIRNKLDVLDTSKKDKTQQHCDVASLDSKDLCTKEKNYIYKKETKESNNKNVAISTRLILVLEKFNQLTLDGSKDDNFKYANMVLRYKLLPYFSNQQIEPTSQIILQAFRRILENTSEFHRKNMTNFKYIYNNFAKIAISENEYKIINLDEYESRGNS